MGRAPVFLLLLLAAFTVHAERVIDGTTASGAYYHIAVPDGWKSGDTLILFQHGLTFEPPHPITDLGPISDLQLSEGYACSRRPTTMPNCWPPSSSRSARPARSSRGAVRWAA
jgi:hypothetical protein